MKPKPFLLTWLVTSGTLFLLNGVFHGGVAANFFDTQLSVLGDVVLKMKDFNPGPIVILELLIDFCLIMIITGMKNEKVVMKEAVLTGGMFYLSTSATWNLANAATFVSWPVILTIVDTSWHFASGLFAGWIICRLFNRQFVAK